MTHYIALYSECNSMQWVGEETVAKPYFFVEDL